MDSVKFFVFTGEEDIVLEKEASKGKSKAKSMRSYAGDSRSKKKAQGTRSSLDSPMPDKSSFPSTSSVPEVGKDGGKGKVMDFVKIFSQGGGGESLGQSSRWRAREVPVTDINKYGPKAKDTVKVSDQQKKSTPVTPSMVCVSVKSRSSSMQTMLLCSVVCDSLRIIHSCRTRIRRNLHRQLRKRFQIIVVSLVVLLNKRRDRNLAQVGSWIGVSD